MNSPAEPDKETLNVLGLYQTVNEHLELEEALGGAAQFDKLEELFRRYMPRRDLGQLNFDAQDKTVHSVMEHAAQFLNTFSYQISLTLPGLPSELQLQLRSGMKPLDRFVTYLLTSMLISHLGCITTLGQILLTPQEQDVVFERMIHHTRTNHRPMPRSLESRFIVSYVEDHKKIAYCLLPDQVRSFTRYSCIALDNSDILGGFKNTRMSF